MKSVRHGEKGHVLVLVLATMFLGTVMVSSSLSLVSTSVKSSESPGASFANYAAAEAGAEHGFWRLRNEPGFAGNLLEEIPQGYVLDLNGKDVTVTVTKIPDPPPSSTSPGSESGRELRTEKKVQPYTATTGVSTTFTYNFTVYNSGEDTMELVTIYDLLPSGLSYVSGSSTGITSNDPQISGNELKWESLSYFIPSEGNAMLTFQAQSTPSEGVLCNEAWVDPGGQSKTTTSLTAKVVVGSPSSVLCPGASASVVKSIAPVVAPSQTPQTYTYTISVRNTGATTFNLKELRHLLPEGFVYAQGSSSGMTSADPSVSGSSGQVSLTWAYGPEITIQPGASNTQVLQVVVTPASNEYYNEVWAIFNEIPYVVYTGSTTAVDSYGELYQITSQVGGLTLLVDVRIRVGGQVTILSWVQQ